MKLLQFTYWILTSLYRFLRNVRIDGNLKQGITFYFDTEYLDCKAKAKIFWKTGNSVRIDLVICWANESGKEVSLSLKL